MSEIDDILSKKDNDIYKKIDKLTDEPVKDIAEYEVVEETEEEPVENIEFNKEEKEQTIKNTIKHVEKTQGKLRRREKKMIKNAEYDATAGRVRETTIGLAIVGIIAVILLRNFFPNTGMFTIMIIIGATSFMPSGMILGWLLFDPVMRCKVIRKLSRRNYGIINFVGHGNKAFPKIKNFDYSLIWRQNECWVLAKSRVYQMTKDGNAINKGKDIDPNSVITYVDTVPVLFVDMHSMEPIKISREGRTDVYPGEIGSALKAWVDNQRAKMMAVKKVTDTMLMIAIVACVGAVVISFITMQKVEEMSVTINSLKSQVQNLINNLQATPP